MRKLNALLSWVARALVALALLAMMVITCFDVVGRYVISRPVPGATELVQYLLVTTIFIALPVVTWRNEHISITLIDSLLGSVAGRIQRFMVASTAALVVAVLCQRFWQHGQMLAENRDVIGFLNLPVAPAAFLASLFSGVTVLILATMAWVELTGGSPPHRSDDDLGRARD